MWAAVFALITAIQLVDKTEMERKILQNIFNTEIFLKMRRKINIADDYISEAVKP